MILLAMIGCVFTASIRLTDRSGLSEHAVANCSACSARSRSCNGITLP